MKKYLAGLAVLLILAAGVFVTAQEKPAPPAKPRAAQAPQGQGPGPLAQAPLERLKQWLGLTPEQVTKLQETRKAQQEAQKGFRDQMQKLRGELNPLIRDPKADPNKVNGLFDQIGKLGTERAKKGYQDRLGLQKILTPEQLTKLQSLRRPGMGMRGGMGMGMGRGGAPMGRGQMMGPRGGMQGRMGMGMGRGMGMGPRGGTRVLPRLRLRILRWLRGW
jgi:Spy/CpxP family protein refolding chaperone